MGRQTKTTERQKVLREVERAIISRLENREPHKDAWLEQKMIVHSTILSLPE
jgi:hypothetical protein